MLGRCPKKPQAFSQVSMYTNTCLTVPDPFRGVTAKFTQAPFVAYSCTFRQTCACLLDWIEVGKNLYRPLPFVSFYLTVLSLLRRCFFACVLLLLSTRHAVCGRPMSTAATHVADTLPTKQNHQVQASPFSLLCSLMQCRIAAHLDSAA